MESKQAPRTFPFRGSVVWLTPDQGGRSTGPPAPRDAWPYYAANGYVPPATAETGLVSLVVRGFTAGNWRSVAEACWLVPDNPSLPRVEVGSVLVVSEGPKPVGFFLVEEVVAE